MERSYIQSELRKQKSSFATLLLTLAAWGEISWSRTQQLAQAIVDDADQFGQIIHPCVEAIGKLGASGVWMQNVRRDGLRLVPVWGFSEPLWKNLPFYDTKDKKVAGPASGNSHSCCPL